MVYVNTRRRTYQLRKRAERQAETRQRIVEAAVALHEELGTAQTTISGIADRAGVGRPTVYRHFPDDRSLFSACTGHYFAQHPPPDPTGWRRIGDPEERLRCGLLETYRWYRETEPMSTKMFRDLPAVPVLEEVLAPLFNGFVDAQTALADAWPRPVSPMLHAAIGHALAFSTWRSLACEHGLRDETTVDLLTAMVVATTRLDVRAAA